MRRSQRYSARSTKQGSRTTIRGSVVLRNLLSQSGGRVIYPVNPQRESVHGVAAYPDITSLPIDPGDDECNTAGAKGLGEPVTIPTAAAVANAVYHATGVRVTAAPINPTRLAELLAQRRDREGR